MRATFVLVWVFVVETALHLVNSTIAGIHEQLFATASNFTWLILTFYIPLLWVSLGLVAWQLYSRRDEQIALVRASNKHATTEMVTPCPKSYFSNGRDGGIATKRLMDLGPVFS